MAKYCGPGALGDTVTASLKKSRAGGEVSDDMAAGQVAAEQRPGTGDDKELFAASYVELRKLARFRQASERTVQRDWEKARLLLFRDLETGA